MTDDPNARPADDEGLEPEEVAADGGDGEAGGEDAGDLDDAQLEAATEGAENEIEGEREDAEHGERKDAEGARGDSDADQEDAEADDDTVVTGVDGADILPVWVPGSRPAEPEPEPRGPRARGPKPARTMFAIDPGLRIQDRASAVFVILCVVVFAAILANAMLFGRGGALSPVPTASPITSGAPSVAPTTGPSPSLAPTTAPTTALTLAPTVAPTVLPSVAPTTAPSPAAS